MISQSTVAERGERLVVVVAHPDDETFGCGSLIALASAAGANVTVICATRGESGERRPDPVTDSWPLGLVREAELCHAGVVLGVQEVIILDYVDSGFSGPAPEGALIKAPLAVVALDLDARLAAIQPDVVLTLDGSDGHRDHCHLRDAVTEAVARQHRSVRLVHSCLARSLMQQWAAAMRTTGPGREHLTIDDDALGRPDHELTEVDTSSVLATRERAIACHLSQGSPFDGLPSELRHHFLTTDYIVEISPERSTPDPGGGAFPPAPRKLPSARVQRLDRHHIR
jgi:N-acetyl-1-D-myo-inositol-2-amino-2-deoxy-alpha-D-glucopyranoside deacetylase